MPGAVLENRLAEVAMAALAPCDLGDGIEVVHDVEKLEIEMDCDLAEVAPIARIAQVAHVGHAAQIDDLASTLEFARLDEVASTLEFARFSAPYERIELQLDASAYRRATIEDARRILTSQHGRSRGRAPRR